jgi:hypothetical protein
MSVQSAAKVHTVQLKCSELLTDATKLTSVANIPELTHTNFQEYSSNGNLIVAEKVQFSSSAVPFNFD